MLPNEKPENIAKRPKPPYFKSLKEYSEATSIHGTSYLFANRLIFYEKALWFVIVAVAVLFAVLSSLSTYNKWIEDPILTSVATTAYPVGKVQFPSITICAQGAANDIVDAAIFKQFVEYLEGKNLIYDQLSEEEVQQETYNFLNDRYPGSRQLPNQLVRMLGSPDVEPDNKIESRVILNPEEVTACYSPSNLNQNITNVESRRKKRELISMECPEGFAITGSGSCWHSSTQSMTYEEAVQYCNDQGNGIGEILHFLDDDEITELYQMLKLQGKTEEGTEGRING